MIKKYNLFNKEKKIYSYWKNNNFFNPNINNNNKNNFSIIMPPPNITGNLHIGHAFQQTIIDIIVRYNKMKGKNILWLMGTDHAGISTQILVENYLKKKKIKLSKKKIIKEIWKWKKKYENKINKQTKLIGSSVYWKKTHFSLNKNFKYAVKKAFIKLYNQNLIYKKKKIVNWDKNIKCSLSNLEINIKKKKVKNYFIKFKIFKKNKYIIVKTTKPEKILSITAIISNNNNKFLINPVTKKLIKIIKNKNINKNIKIIPNYYNKDFKFAIKNKLNLINIFNINGNIYNKIKLYNYKKNKKKILKFKNLEWIKNLNYLTVRKKIINFLKKKKLIKNIKYKYIKIKYSNKTNSIIIPILTNQWYIKTNSLSKKILKNIKDKKILIFPKKYKKLFFYWMKNIKDWCISRQIYWGHRIPIWYDKDKNKYIGYNIKYIKKKYPNIKNKKLKQDKNILDTWFSSSLWSFTSLGWPNKKNKLKNFHPLSLIVSGFDIIYFWICRMIMMTLFLIKKNNKPQIPFKKIFITGLLRDENGKKMSKSLGNVIEISDLIKGISFKKLLKKRIKNLINNNEINKIKKNTKKFFPNGIKSNKIDTIRFYLTSIYNSKLKINFNKNEIIFAYNYCNKLWNVCKFIFEILKINKNSFYKKKININKLFLIEKWILYKFNKLILNFRKNIYLFKFNLLCKDIFKFLKNYFCNWYIESIKLNIINKNSKLFIIYIIKNFLKISHLITPFITEYIWKKNYTNSILNQKFPNLKFKLNNLKKYKNIFNIFKKIIFILRKFKKDKKIKLNKLIILNLNLFNKNILIKNKYLFKIIKLNKIYYFKKSIFLKIYKKYKYKKLILIKKNIYISYK